MFFKRLGQRFRLKGLAGYLWAAAGIAAITPLVLQLDPLVGMPSSALPYVVVTVAIQYRYGIGPAAFSIAALMLASDYFLLEPRGVVWPIFRAQDQVHLVTLAVLTLPATAAASVVRRALIGASEFGSKAALLASTANQLENELQSRSIEALQLQQELTNLQADFERLESSSEELSAAHKAGSEELEVLHSSLQLLTWFPHDVVAGRILEKLIPAVGADMGSVWAYDPEGVSISLVAQEGYLEGLLRPRELLYIPYDGLMHKILASGSPFCGVPDSSGPFLRLTYASGGRSLVVIPLKSSERIIGFFSVASELEKGFAPDMRLLSSIANVLALSLQAAKQGQQADFRKAA